jgi:hypothetical protein
MTKEETLKAIADLPPFTEKTQFDHFSLMQKLPVSEWALAEYEACKQYPYLSSCARELNEKHTLGLDARGERDLESFLYFASKEIKKRRDAREGWIYASEEWLRARVGKHIEVRRESIFGFGFKKCRVIEVAGKVYVVPPRARNKAYPIYDLVVRDLGGPVPSQMAGAMKVSINGKEA